MQPRFRLWLIGLLLGSVGIPFALYGLGAVVVTALVVVVALRRPRPAGTAGFLVAFGAWWLWLVFRSIERCAAFNRQPGGYCEMPKVTLDVAVPLIFFAAGVALTLVTFRSSNPNRGVAVERGT